jgi:hypothetical protein
MAISVTINLNAPDFRLIIAEKTKLKIIKGKTKSKHAFIERLMLYKKAFISVEIWAPKKRGSTKTKNKIAGRPIFLKKVALDLTAGIVDIG